METLFLLIGSLKDDGKAQIVSQISADCCREFVGDFDGKEGGNNETQRHQDTKTHKEKT